MDLDTSGRNAVYSSSRRFEERHVGSNDGSSGGSWSYSRTSRDRPSNLDKEDKEMSLCD